MGVVVQHSLTGAQQPPEVWRAALLPQHSLTGSQHSAERKQQLMLCVAASPLTHNAPAITITAHSLVNIAILLMYHGLKCIIRVRGCISQAQKRADCPHTK